MYNLSGNKEERILSAAYGVFIRFGFKRTTMGDLAAAAEMSRPSLYASYCNKTEIFRALVKGCFEQVVQQTEEGLSNCLDVEQQLTVLMDAWVIGPYKEVQSSSEAGDIFEAGYSLAQDIRQYFKSIYAEQISVVLKQLNTTLDLSSMAHLMANASLGLTREVESQEELENQLKEMRKIYLAVS